MSWEDPVLSKKWQVGFRRYEIFRRRFSIFLTILKKAVKLKPKSNKAQAGLARACKGALQKRPRDRGLQHTYTEAVRKSGDKDDYKKALEHVIRVDLFI